MAMSVKDVAKECELDWVMHKWTTSAMEFKQLVSPYLSKQRQDTVGYMGTAIDFIETCQDLREVDLREIKQFLSEYIEMFGNPDKKSYMYGACTFSCIAHIWYNNKTRFSPSVIKNRMLKLRGHPRAVFYADVGASRTNTLACRREFIDILNGSRTREDSLFN